MRVSAVQSITRAGHRHTQPSCKERLSSTTACEVKTRQKCWLAWQGCFPDTQLPSFQEKMPCGYNFQCTWRGKWLQAWQVARDIGISDHAASPHPNVMYNTADLPSKPVLKHNDSELVQRCLATKKVLGAAMSYLTS